MNYFKDVYLTRINRYGDTLQGRIVGKMENDFKVFLERSLNRVEFEIESEKYFGVLQSETVNEKETIDYLLTEKSIQLAGGMIFMVGPQHWMVLLQEKYQTMGYNKYKVILLEKEISWIEDAIIHTSWAHQMSTTGNLNARDRAIATNFKISDNVAVDVPTKTMQLVMPANSHINRRSKFNLNDATWVVYGYDKISLENIMAITLKETYTEDGELANIHELNGWTLTTNMGDEIVSTDAGKIDMNVEFLPFYNGSPAEQKADVKCEDSDLTIERVDGNIFHLQYAGSKTSFMLDVSIAGTQVELNVPISIAPSSSYIAVVGPQKIKVDESAEYTIASNLQDYNISIMSENGCFEIVDTLAGAFTIKGKSIGKDNIVLTYEGNIIKTPLEVLSFWM